MNKNEHIKEAKKSLKAHIKFLESLQTHIKRGEEPMLSRAMFTTYCIHRYLNDELMNDVEMVMKKNQKQGENK